MRTATRTLLTLAASVLVLTGCGRLPAQPSDASPAQDEAAHTAASRAERTVHESIYDMTDVFFTFGCSDEGEVLGDHEGERVRIEGQVFERFTVLRDGAGGYHTTWHTMPIGLRGIGVTSGETFRVTERERGGSNQTLMGHTGRYSQVLTLVGRDSGRTFRAVFSGQYTVNANGELVLQRDSARVECKVRR